LNRPHRLSPDAATRRRSWQLIAALWALLLVLAATRPLALPDEGRYAEIGRWMLLSGDWLTPRLDGLPFFHKPPLQHWLQAALYSVLGVSAWVARLVPALHAGLMLVAMYLAGRAVWGEGVARRAVLMLGTSLGFLIGGQYVNHDMVVAAWIGVAIWCFAGALQREPRVDAALARWGFVACALALLTKGLIGIVLPGGVLFFWLLATRRLPRLLQLPWASGLALFALVALPWFVSQQRQFPGFFDYLIIGQHFGRFTGGTHNNQHPWWFYLLVLPVMLPWAFVAVAGALRWLRALARREPVAGPAADRWGALLWSWLLVILVFFSLPRSKLVGYILPVLPALALLSSLAWQRLVAGRRWERRALVAGATACIAFAVAMHVVAGRYTLKRSAADIAPVLACHLRPGDTVHVTGDYPYDLPFLARLPQAMVVVADWPRARREAGDNWRRELFEGADFDAQAARVLQMPHALDEARQLPGQWLVVDNEALQATLSAGWVKVASGRAWTLLRSPASAAERPEASQYEGLGRCQD
jgi:4-amino-4-deoxy-L-arabinose transferase-like glycosyltransferase